LQLLGLSSRLTKEMSRCEDSLSFGELVEGCKR